ncbi:Gfo/Idh/MocA family oxidoreductase [Streptomyces violaceorubidus]|uniref:Gfo/Idh/MocA family oxidoreductase n=1 Tax=Streptomyces violaceorubidus TaxID=284042 RepID=UPI000997958B|nr:Gfo/Idh/MocA family oxidoreductase [Streptomyces violaceorubidus]
MSSHVPNAPLRTAVVGTGSIARSSHLPALSKMAAEGEVEVVAAVDVDEPAVRASPTSSGSPRRPPTSARCRPRHAPPSWCCAHRPPCTPPAVHREQAVAALTAGAWVWCEKPPCPSSADHDAVEAAEQGGGAGPYVSVVFQHRLRIRRPARPRAAVRRRPGPAAGG